MRQVTHTWAYTLYLGTAKSMFKIQALLCYYDMLFDFLLLRVFSKIHLCKRAHSKKEKINRILLESYMHLKLQQFAYS